MRTTTAAWFLPVSLAALLATVTNVSGLAYQAPGSPPADISQVPGPRGPEAEASGPGTSTPAQSPNAATPPPAAPAWIPPRSPVRSGPVQQAYSTAWPYLDFTPTRSAYGGTGSAAANLPLPPTGRAGVNRYPTPLGARGGGSSFTSQAAAQAMSGSRPSARTSVSSRPFSDYSPRSGTSPYMNLFRADSQFGEIDNYTSQVRPVLQQRQTNRQTQWDLRSLRSRSGAQGTQLRELNQRTNALQGTSRPNSFGNYFNYYPGLNR